MLVCKTGKRKRLQLQGKKASDETNVETCQVDKSNKGCFMIAWKMKVKPSQSYSNC